MEGKILLHNITLKGIGNVPGVLDFDQRAVVFADNHDYVITRKKFDKSFLEYLTKLGLDLSATVFLNSTSAAQTYDSIFRDERIKDLLSILPLELFDSYHLTKYESRYASAIRKRIHGNSKLADKFGTKSGFRKLCKKLGLPIVKGYASLHEVDNIISCIQKISKVTKRCLLRLDEGVSGAGNMIISISEFNKLSDIKQRKTIIKFLNRIPQRISTSGTTVEAWIEDVYASPSIQFDVKRSGEIEITSTHDQILEGDEKWYIGCHYPSTTITKEAIASSVVFVEHLMRQGYYGFCGIDILLTPNGHYLAEANLRKVATSYAFKYIRRVYGDRRIHYTAKDLQIPKLKGKNFEYIAHKLDDLLIKKIGNSTNGALVYNTGALEDGGRFDTVVVGDSPKSRLKLLAEILNRLS